MMNYGMAAPMPSPCYSGSSVASSASSVTSESSFASAPASVCSKGHGALQNGFCMVCRWENEDDVASCASSSSSSDDGGAYCKYGHGPKGPEGCAMCNFIAYNQYATPSECSSVSGESKTSCCSSTESDGTCSMTSSSDDLRSVGTCSNTSGSEESKVSHGDDEEATCSQTSSSNNTSGNSNNGDTCSLTSSNETPKEPEVVVDAQKIRNDWLHRLGSKANTMFLEAFREALVEPEEASEIAASFLRFREQCKNMEETHHEMMMSLFGVYKLSEDMRRELTFNLNAQTTIHNQLKVKCKRLESEKVVGAGVELIAESTAHITYSTVGLRIIRYQKYHKACGDWDGVIPAWVWDECIPMPARYNLCF